MKVGERVSFPFATRTMEGEVVRIFEKTVLIKADFPRQKGKIIRRKRFDLENPKKAAKAKKRAKEKKG